MVSLLELDQKISIKEEVSRDITGRENRMKPKIIHTKTFHCDDYHPIVWYTFDENNKAICEYCSTQFIYEPDNKKINA